MVQAVAQEKKWGLGSGGRKPFGFFHISAFELADTPDQIKQAAQDAKNAVGNANSKQRHPLNSKTEVPAYECLSSCSAPCLCLHL